MFRGIIESSDQGPYHRCMSKDQLPLFIAHVCDFFTRICISRTLLVVRDNTLIILRNLNSCLRTLEFKGKKICVYDSSTKYENLFVPNTFRGTIQVVPLLCTTVLVLYVNLLVPRTTQVRYLNH